MAGVTAAQVRRDLMAVGYTGSPTRGYGVGELMESIGKFLDASEGEGVALIGVGNLGRAILAYFGGRRPKLAIVAAFDNDAVKVNRVVLGVRCHAMTELAQILAEQVIHTAIITVPAAAAQEVTDQLVRAGVRGLLNFAPASLRVPEGVFVEDIDMTVALEKVAYFARQYAPQS
jgi:redox-sensing transcriptional repressor